MMDWKGALEELMAGNGRFRQGLMSHPNGSPERRRELLAGQKPFAVVLGCSDSRIPPEILFDRGMGDLFVIRVAGNVLDDVVLASIEYAVLHLETPLVLVLGHSSCGAVAATKAGGAAEGKLPALMDAVRPGIEGAGDEAHDAEKVAARRIAASLLEQGAGFRQRLDAGKLMLLPAFFDLDSGEVEILD